jgi:transcriptional regulator with XRE-family HTH domain
MVNALETSSSAVGTRIKLRRCALKLSQLQLAERVRVTQASVSYWEDSRVPLSLPRVYQLAKALGCNPVWLAFGLGDPGFTEDASAANGANGDR